MNCFILQLGFKILSKIYLHHCTLCLLSKGETQTILWKEFKVEHLLCEVAQTVSGSVLGASRVDLPEPAVSLFPPLRLLPGMHLWTPLQGLATTPTLLFQHHQ